MSSVIEIRPKEGVPDVRGEGTASYIRNYIGVPVRSVSTRTLYCFFDDITPEQARIYSEVLLADGVVEDHEFLGNIPVYEQPATPEGYRGSWEVRVGQKIKPMALDNWGEATRRTLEVIFGSGLGPVRKLDSYVLEGDLTKEDVQRICAEEKLADTKVQTVVYIPRGNPNG